MTNATTACETCHAECDDAHVTYEYSVLDTSCGEYREWDVNLQQALKHAADLQEQVLALEAVDGMEPMAERTLREVAHAGTWAEQRAKWTTVTENQRDVVHLKLRPQDPNRFSVGLTWRG